MPDQPEIVIVDDDTELLSALQEQVAAMGYQTSAFADPRVALDHVSENARNACLLLDLQMPNLTGLELQVELNKLTRPFAVVFLSGQAGIPETVKAIQSGAVDFLEKPVEHLVLAEALARACTKLDAMTRKHAQEAAALKRIACLTVRERGVFEELAKMATTKEIAHKLEISEHTVTNHRASIMRKLEASGVQDLVAIAKSLTPFVDGETDFWDIRLH